MNPIIRSLHERKSVRAYDEKPVGQAERDAIVDAALQAPSAGNQALYTILEIEDQEIKERLSILCDNQPFIAKAPYVLVFLADCRRWFDAYVYAGASPRDPGPGDLLLACADTFIAAQNAVVAAESLGIGSCYVGDILENKEAVCDLLGLDAYTVPAAMLTFGYPTEQQRNREKPKRFDRIHMLQKDRYRRLDEQEIREMYNAAFAERTGATRFSFDRDIAAFCARKYMSDFALEMNRSVGEYLKSFHA